MTKSNSEYQQVREDEREEYREDEGERRLERIRRRRDYLRHMRGEGPDGEGSRYDE